MIARLWSARTTPQLSAAYLEYFLKNVLPELQSIPGYVSANVLTTTGTNANEIEILVQTIWQSLEAITAFAGPDREAAVVHPAAAALLTTLDRRVRHFNLSLSDPAK